MSKHQHLDPKFRPVTPVFEFDVRDSLLERTAWFRKDDRIVHVPCRDGRPGFDVAVRIDGSYTDTDPEVHAGLIEYFEDWIVEASEQRQSSQTKQERKDNE